MTNIKRRISAFAAALAMMGAVTVPSAAQYMTNETATTVSAASDDYILFFAHPCIFRADVKAKTKFRAEPCNSAKVVASVKKRTYNQKVYLTMVAVTDEGAWYYSQYDKGWVRNADLIRK